MEQETTKHTVLTARGIEVKAIFQGSLPYLEAEAIGTLLKVDPKSLTGIEIGDLVYVPVSELPPLAANDPELLEGIADLLSSLGENHGDLLTALAMTEAALKEVRALAAAPMMVLILQCDFLGSVEISDVKEGRRWINHLSELLDLALAAYDRERSADLTACYGYFLSKIAALNRRSTFTPPIKKELIAALSRVFSEHQARIAG